MSYKREFLYFYDKERSYLKVIMRYLQSLQSKLNTRDVIYTEIWLWQASVFKCSNIDE